MRNKLLIATGFLLLYALSLLAVDARSSGRGGTSVSISDLWSVQNNPSGIGFLKNTETGICYTNSFLIKELGIKSAAAVFPVKGGTFGLLISNYGYSLFSQNKMALSFGKSFGDNFSGGISIDYFSTSIPDYGKKKSFAAEAGVQAKPFKNFTLGVHIFNVSKTKLAPYNDERLPVIMRLGFDYKFSEKVFFSAETEKDIESAAIIKAGVEYKPINEFFIRSGFSTNPSQSHFGIGIFIKQFRMDISSSFHYSLGISPNIGISYLFEKRKKEEK